MKKILSLALALALVYAAQATVRFVETRLARNELNAIIAKEPEFKDLHTLQEGLSKVYVIGTLASKRSARKLVEESDRVLRHRLVFKPRVLLPADAGYLLRQSD